MIAAAAFWWGSSYYAAFTQTRQPDFGQTEFSAAVMLACGRGFAQPAISTPALDAFLGSRVDTFSCDQLTTAMTPHGVNFTQKLYRYLMTAVAWQWKWSGISWSGLSTLAGVLFALTSCAAYGLFRLAAPVPVAMAGTAAVGMSAHHLGYLPELRDYAKAPFILILMLILAHLVTPPFTRSRALTLSLLFGLVLGIGFGFRNDLLINIPPFLFCLFFVAPGRWRDNLRLKAGCLAAAAAVFVVTSWPILHAYATGSNTGHVAVLGLTSNFDRPLGLTRPVYDLGPHYLDGYAAMLINTESRLRDGRFVTFLSPEYEAAAMGVIAAVARNFPADILVRGLAATRKVLDFPFTVDTLSTATPVAVTSPAVRRFYQQHQQVWLRELSGWGPWLAIASVLVIGASSPRAGVALLFLLLYYAGYPAVQFSLRHYFHLEFIAWWALLFMLATLGVWTWRFAGDGLLHVTSAAWRHAGMTLAVGVIIVAGPLTLLRMYQQRHVTSLIRGYLDAPRSPLPLSRTAAHAGTTLVAANGLWDGRRPGDPIDIRYLAAEFSADGCGAASVPVVLKYDAKTEANDFSFERRVAISEAGPTEWLVPAFYNGQWSHFAGLELPSHLAACLKTISRVDELARMPLLLELHLAPGWETTSLFQRVVGWETAR